MCSFPLSTHVEFGEGKKPHCHILSFTIIIIIAPFFLSLGYHARVTCLLITLRHLFLFSIIIIVTIIIITILLLLLVPLRRGLPLPDIEMLADMLYPTA